MAHAGSAEVGLARGSLALGIVIIAATLFVKQHAFIDVLAGLFVGALGDIIVYVVIGKKRDRLMAEGKRLRYGAVKTPILEGITPEEQEQMRVCFGVREERFRAGETVYDFAEGRKYLGLIARGSAVIQRIDRQGGRTILEHLESGGVFGEMLMFENVAGDSITVIAEEPCRVWFMQDEHVTRRCEKACAHHSRLVENMFHIMTEKAAALSERVEVLSRRSIREKLLCYFGPAGRDSGRSPASSCPSPSAPWRTISPRPQRHDAGTEEDEGRAPGGGGRAAGDPVHPGPVRGSAACRKKTDIL